MEANPKIRRLVDEVQKIKARFHSQRSTYYVIGVFLAAVFAIAIAALILVKTQPPPASVGAANVGTGGVGVFDSQQGQTLGFRSIVGASSKVDVELDAPNKAVDVDVVPNQLGAVCVNSGTGLSGGQCVTLGSNMTLSVTQAQTFTTLSVSQTTLLGTNTTCIAPLLPSCYDISLQSCPGGSLQQNCFPANAFFDNLVVNNLIVNNSTLNGGGGGIQNSTAAVLTSLALDGPMICSVNGSVPQSCFDLSGYVCPNGLPLSDSCIPASLAFADLTSTNTLTVNNVQCSGPHLPNSCVSSPYASTIFGTPSPLTLVSDTSAIDLLGAISSGGYDMAAMALFPANVMLSTVSFNGVIGTNWTAGCYTIELYYTTAGAPFATSSSVCFNGITTQTVGGKAAFATLGTLSGTLAVTAGVPFFIRLQTSVLTCSDLRLSVIINAMSS